MKTWTLIAILIALPIAGCQTSTACAQAAAPVRADVTFEIIGMVSESCPTLVKSAVRRIDGVVAVEASLESKSATVTYDPSKTDPEAIRRIIEDRVGFDARVRR